MKAMNFIWPIEDQWNHCNIRSVLQRPDIEPYWTELYQAINGIQWDDLINLHNHEHNHRMSMSVAISERIDNQLTELGAKDNVSIFSDKLVNGKDRYRIWKKLGPIAIDYAFGHPDGLRWKLNRLASSIIPIRSRRTFDNVTSTPHFSQITPRCLRRLYFPQRHS